jgi:hypothetical protein
VGRIGSDAGVVDDPTERLPDHRVKQPFPGQRGEEGRILSARLQLLAQPGVVSQRLHAAGLQRDQPGFAELGLADQQHPIRPVDVVPVELDRLPDPKASGGQQPDHGAVGRRP